MTAADACPGLLDLHEARDGYVARIRLPGGYADATRLHALAALASRFGSGCVDLTARGNVQLRGVRAAEAGELARRAARAGLLPSPAHDRARNITASPLAGLAGHPDLRRLVRALDRALLADPGLAVLPGRFLFCLDDGTGRAGLSSCDVGVRRSARRGPHRSARGAELIVAGRQTGLRGPAELMVRHAVTAARAFARRREAMPAVTRMTGLPDGGARIAADLGGTLGERVADTVARLPLGPLPDPAPDSWPAAAVRGPAAADPWPAAADPWPAAADPWPAAAVRGPAAADPWPAAAVRGPAATAAAGLDAPYASSVVVAAPLARLTAPQLRLLGRMLRPGEAARLTAAGRVVLPLAEPADAALSRLAEAGLLVSDHHILSAVTACSGMSCLSSLADVRSRAARVPGLAAVHWAGCDRRCGLPADATAVVATSADEFAIVGHDAPARRSTIADQTVTVTAGQAATADVAAAHVLAGRAGTE